MQVADFDYVLPPERIARYPLAQRAASRLLCLERTSGMICHRNFAELATIVRSGDLLVVNDTRVIPARLHARKATGGQVEVLLERILGQDRALAQVRASKSPKVGSRLLIAAGCEATVLGRQGTFFELQFTPGVAEALAENGEMPLPPYLERGEEDIDQTRYQTVYAGSPGAVAAPTAGLHFDQALLDTLAAAGVHTASVTLHVGAGTFQPVRTDRVVDHQMHAEYLEVEASVCEAVRATRARGGRVIAVGTTSVRALETASHSGEIEPWKGDTRAFIYPGYVFRSVDAMITNFHLPRSTLLMLVAAFAGTEQVLDAYRVAVAEKYRFFSYGDAMLIGDGVAP